MAAASTADCAATGATLTTNGCTVNGNLVCNDGYTPAYNGSSLTCTAEPTGTPPTECAAAGATLTTNGCTVNGSLFCNAGYAAEYDGSSLTCAPSGNTQPSADGTTNTGTDANPNDAGGTVSPDAAAASGNCSASTSQCDLISQYIQPLVNLLAALVGVAVVISIIIGGIQYGSSAGDPQKVSAAKNRIRNAIIALITFIFLYALLNFLIPGGLV